MAVYHGRTKKKPRNVSEKSLANLRPQKPGTPSHNPEGGRAHNPVFRAMKEATLEAYVEVIKLVMRGTREELRELAKSETVSALQCGIAKAMLDASDSGDEDRISRICARVIGSVPKEINLNANTNSNVNLTAVSKEMLIEAIKRIQSDV